MQLQRRVVVTGLGILSPIGNSKDTAWSNCINGVNGITEVDFGIADCPVTVGGKLKDLDLENEKILDDQTLVTDEELAVESDEVENIIGIEKKDEE